MGFGSWDNSWNLPDVVRRMPLDLRRSHNVFKCPECFSSTLDEYEHAMRNAQWEPPQYFPQRMVNSQYKSPPSAAPRLGARPQWSGQAATVVGAATSTRPSGTLLRTMGVPVSPLRSSPAAMQAHAMGLNRLPRAMTQPQVALAVIAKGMPQQRGVPPHAIAAQTGRAVAQRLSSRQAQGTKTANAIASARLAVRTYNRLPGK